MPTGFTTVSGSHLQDATGTLIANGTIYFKPVDNNGNSISFRAGSSGEGQAMSEPVSATISSGVFSIQLADTSLTTPVNVGYAVSVIDNVTGKSLLGSGYGCVQPSGSTWNFDTYIPNLSPQVSVIVGGTGPAGPPLTPRGAYSSGTTYAKGDVVTAASSSYISLQDANTANSPTATSSTWWMLLASKGQDGVSGVPKQLFDPTAIVASNYILASDGTVNAGASNHFASAMMTVVAGLSYVTNEKIEAVGATGIAWYGGGTFISGATGLIAADTPMVAPTGADGLRITGTTANISTQMVFQGTEMPPIYIPFGQSVAYALSQDFSSTLADVTALEASVSTTIAAAVSAAAPVNLLNPATVTTDSFILATDGTVNNAGGATTYGSSALMPVTAGHSYYTNMRVLPTGNTGIAWYDSSGTYISGIYGGILPGTAMVAPTGATGLRITLQTADAPTQFVIDGIYPSFFVSYNQLLTIATANQLATTNTAATTLTSRVNALYPLAGKKYALFGDSISQILSNYWQSNFESVTGITKVYQNATAGIGPSQFVQGYTATGNTWPSGTPPTGFIGQTVGHTLAQDLVAAAPDVVIIQLGTNEGTVTVGTPGDAFSAHTYCGNVLNVLDVIGAILPNVPIIWIGPYGYNIAAASSWATQSALQAGTLAMKETCGLRGVPFVDLFRLSNINKWNWGALTYEGVHINPLGASGHFVPFVANTLRQMFS